ncbi:hypothetical protein ERJ75_001332900 [Trypanosoma vivax]|uniref:Uncharacterized protein n=1 Tax=Trypanosoma vivax (strain Y486) TaxID=1055687 RepID=G0U609_TRYVY|nr:hypothetical protein TRVL_05741 [Trypanosoma vivax]KAH8607954.1 hypothetical protein ERJ75_001332900 [Trypanosoma vivax]CCC51310.1 conserved hypothetical protein [Trypanosoma vivax Y486]
MLPGPGRCHFSDGQRHHRNRVGRMLVPHGRVAGLIFTANPRQEAKALRELQLYLGPLVSDLENASAAGGVANVNLDNAMLPSAGSVAAGPAATSDLLFAELSAAARGGQAFSTACATVGESAAVGGISKGIERKRHRGEDGAGHTAPQNVSRWFAPLETGCKGYLMVSVPFPEALETKEAFPGDEATAKENAPKREGEGLSTGPLTDSASSAHLIIHNPLVRTVVERIFKDIEESPKPFLRNCFRLLPCELTCCPTLREMRMGLERLVEVYFPASVMGRGMRKVGLSLLVKNNTDVERRKAYLQAALGDAFPANRFCVIPAKRLGEYPGGVEALFVAFVAHSTCAMGVQWRFTERAEYNLHAIGAKSIELACTVKGGPKLCV